MELQTPAARRIRAGLGSLLAAAVLGTACLAAGGCASAPPAPPLPEPAPVVPDAVPAAPPPPPSVRVTGSRLNVREAPTTSARSVAKVARGTRLVKLSEQGEWIEVELADGARGWVHGRYVSAEPECPPDTADPAIVSEPVLGFVEGASHGRIVIEGTVSRTGDVVAVEVRENSTGSPDLEALAADELRRMRFAPFVRKCRPVPFIYVYTRTF